MNYTLEEVRELLRQDCAEAGSQSAWSRRHSLPQQHVSEALRGTRRPSDRILAALGLEKSIAYHVKREPLHLSSDSVMSDEGCLAHLTRATVLGHEQEVAGWRRALAERPFNAHWEAEEIYKSAHEGFPSEEGLAEASALYARAETLREVEGVEELFKELLDAAECEEAELRSYDEDNEEYDE